MTRVRGSKRITELRPFKVMEILQRAQDLQAQGREIFHLEVGEPDFVSPAPVLAAAQSALDEGKTHYTAAVGLGSLRQKIALYYQREFAVTVAPERIIITVGASAALKMAMDLLFDPHDEVLLCEPGYPCNGEFVRFAGAIPRVISLSADNGFCLTHQQLQSAWTPRSKGLVLATPANPTGAIIAKNEMNKIAGEIATRGGALIVDEIYQGLQYEGRGYSSLEISDDVLVVNSFSKFFGMTGWRLGWLVVPEALQEYANRLAQNFYIAPPTLAQYAALAAFTAETMEILQARREAFKQRRDYMLQALIETGFRIPYTPEGAFYIYAGIKGFGLDSETFAQQLLVQSGVAITPGTDFSPQTGRDFVRFAYTTDLPRLQRAMELIQRFVGQLD